MWLHGLISRPIASGSARWCAVVAGVEAPRELGFVELVAERLVVEARLLLSVDSPAWVDYVDEVLETAAAAPQAKRQVNRGVRLRRDYVLVRDEAFIELRLEHPIGHDPLMRHIEVRFRVLVRNVDVLRIGRPPIRELAIEAVHPAIGAGKFAGSRRRPGTSPRPSGRYRNAKRGSPAGA